MGLSHACRPQVNRQVAQCNCAKRFQVEQISANRYRVSADPHCHCRLLPCHHGQQSPFPSPGSRACSDTRAQPALCRGPTAPHALWLPAPDALQQQGGGTPPCPVGSLAPDAACCGTTGRAVLAGTEGLQRTRWPVDGQIWVLVPSLATPPQFPALPNSPDPPHLALTSLSPAVRGVPAAADGADPAQHPDGAGRRGLDRAG